MILDMQDAIIELGKVRGQLASAQARVGELEGALSYYAGAPWTENKTGIWHNQNFAQRANDVLYRSTTAQPTQPPRHTAETLADGRCDKCGDIPYLPHRQQLIGMGCVCGGIYRRDSAPIAVGETKEPIS